MLLLVFAGIAFAMDNKDVPELCTKVTILQPIMMMQKYARNSDHACQRYYQLYKAYLPASDPSLPVQFIAQRKVGGHDQFLFENEELDGWVIGPSHGEPVFTVQNTGKIMQPQIIGKVVLHGAYGACPAVIKCVEHAHNRPALVRMATAVAASATRSTGQARLPSIDTRKSSSTDAYPDLVYDTRDEKQAAYLAQSSALSSGKGVYEMATWRALVAFIFLISAIMYAIRSTRNRGGQTLPSNFTDFEDQLGEFQTRRTTNSTLRDIDPGEFYMTEKITEARTELTRKDSKPKSYEDVQDSSHESALAQARPHKEFDTISRPRDRVQRRAVRQVYSQSSSVSPRLPQV